MISDKGKITYIHYCVQDQVLASFISPDRPNYAASIEKYAHLCGETLKREYTNAVIEIDHDTADGVLPAAKDTRVFTWQEDGKDIEDSHIAQEVDSLCDNLVKRFDEWIEPVNTIPALESPKFCSGLHPVLVRWACFQKEIKGAFIQAGVWNVPLKATQEFAGRLDNATLPATYRAACIRILVWEDLGEISLSQIDETVSAILVSRDGFGGDILTQNSSCFLLSRVPTGVNLVAEHFVDVEPWAHSRWTYDAYCEHLAKQAERLKVVSELRISARNDTTTVNGIVFHLTERVVPDIVVRDFIKSWLRTLSELVDTTEISLAGGPVWDEVYERNEDRFCREVLSPLLQKMNFRSVRYTHGSRKEHGRDFVMEYETPFHETMYYGLQAKRGNIKGGVNSGIDQLVDQIVTAFEVPYRRSEPEKSSSSEVYISCMIVAISGEFTDDALDKLRAKMSARHYVRGNVFFWDKHKIKSLIAHNWGRSKQ